MMSNLIRVSESDDWIVDYDRERGMYRVSYFEDCHFVDEFWFDAYEEREVSMELLYKPDKSYCSLLDLGNINVSPTFTAENSKFNLEYLE